MTEALIIPQGPKVILIILFIKKNYWNRINKNKMKLKLKLEKIIKILFYIISKKKK